MGDGFKSGGTAPARTDRADVALEGGPIAQTLS